MSITAIPPLPAIAGEDRDSATRAAFIEGLRALAGVLEMYPEQVPLPFHGRLDPVTIHFLAGDDPRAAMTAAADAIGPGWREGISDYTETGGGTYHDLTGNLHGLRLRLTAPLNAAPETAGAGSETDSETEAA